MSIIPAKKRGRPKGARNKRSRSLVDMTTKFLEENLDEFKACFYELSPKARANAYLDLLPFAVPKRTASSLEMKCRL